MPQTDRSGTKKSIWPMIASLLSILGGAIGLSLCLASVLFYTEGTLYTAPLIGELLSDLAGYAIVLGGIAVVLFSYHIVAGYMLWKRVKIARPMITAASLMDIALYLAFAIISPAVILLASPLLILGLVLLSTTIAG